MISLSVRKKKPAGLFGRRVLVILL